MDRSEVKAVAKRLADCRRKRLLSQAEVAEACGLSAGAIGNYEAGRNVPNDDVKRTLAAFYETTVGRLFFGE